MQFPSVEGENLTGQQLAFPRDFGSLTIAIVAFDLKARGDLESWVPFVDRHVRAGTVIGRIFPVMPHSMHMMRKMIVATMRKAVPTEARAATMPIFVDIDAFCTALGIPDRSTLHIMVVDAGGNVREHQTGAFGPLAAAAIEAQLATPA